MIIGIAGGTCSGKTSLSLSLASKLDARVISLDDYFKDPSTFPRAYGHPDYDRINAIDWDAALEDLQRIGSDVIVEGFLALAVENLRERFTVSFYIDLNEDLLISRRLVREPDTKPEYITVLVRERHHTLVLPTMGYADVILDGARPTDELVDEVYGYLSTMPSSEMS